MPTISKIDVKNALHLKIFVKWENITFDDGIPLIEFRTPDGIQSKPRSYNLINKPEKTYFTLKKHIKIHD